ncbi:MAG TPA: chemotaxis protein CheR, partial [Cyanobacteria bacterium UBA12227]|nr:chemotaxis protein CheR [Cyanobacteria bacterium UBA12227]
MTLKNSDFDYIRQLVRDRTGVVLSEDKDYLIESRLTLLAKEAGENSVSGLVAKVRQERFNPLYELIIEA